jgi:hypothetical protein
MQARILVFFLNSDITPHEFQNAEVAVAAPGLFVIQNTHGDKLAMYPIGAVAGITFPDGPNRITEVSL